MRIHSLVNVLSHEQHGPHGEHSSTALSKSLVLTETGNVGFAITLVSWQVWIRALLAFTWERRKEVEIKALFLSGTCSGACVKALSKL